MKTPDIISLSSTEPAPANPVPGEVLISVQNVSKRFCRDLKQSLWQGVQDIAGEILSLGTSDGREKELRKDEFWAVKDISFQLRRGECLALIGRNGAGKTTLLKILNGLIKPDQGRVEMRGRVGAMIALGAGFNPVLTGRENIYVTGSIRGMSKKEIDDRIEDIIDFSEIRDFIDMPVQSYSSGMQVRLGFSVATALAPDIMLVDEVLAVGDGAFRFKCLKRIAEMMKTSAVILVSHNMVQIGKVCSRGVVMEKGRLVVDGETRAAIESYNRLNEEGVKRREKAAKFFDYPLTGASLEVMPQMDYLSPFTAILNVESREPLPGFYVLVRILDSAEQVVGEISNYSASINLPDGRSRVEIHSETLSLKPGVYAVNILLHLNSSPAVLARLKNHEIRIEGKSIPWEAPYQLPARLRILD